MLAAAMPLSIALLAGAIADDDRVDARGHASDGALIVEAIASDARGGSLGSTNREAVREFLRAAPCVAGVPVGAADDCSPLSGATIDCPAGMTPILPLWYREQQPDGVWGPWTVATWFTCPSESELLALIEREWTQLRPAPSTPRLQPDSDWVYATIPTIAMAEDHPHTHTAELLGASVTIVATPALYTWSWGDGQDTVTSDPGRPYPDASISHVYGPAIDAATVSLSTTWSGEFRIGDGEWRTFDTTIATASPAIALDVRHPRSHLVADLVTDG